MQTLITMKHQTLNILLILIIGIALSGCEFGKKNEKVIQLDCGIYLKVVRWPTENLRTYISVNSNLKDTVNEPYFTALDFFYKVESCRLIILKADTLNRSQLKNPNITIQQKWTTPVNFKNFNRLGFENILYQ